jgi:hypothetical protein
LNFDIDTAIKATRQAGYYEHALYLARRHNEHNSYLKILLEDLKGFNDALEYIATLDFFEVKFTECCVTFPGREKLEALRKDFGNKPPRTNHQLTNEIMFKLCTHFFFTGQTY